MLGSSYTNRQNEVVSLSPSVHVRIVPSCEKTEIFLKSLEFVKDSATTCVWT